MMLLLLHAHYNFDTTFRCLQNSLSAANAKCKFKNGKKIIGAFEKHADEVTSGGPILPKISEVVRK